MDYAQGYTPEKGAQQQTEQEQTGNAELPPAYSEIAAPYTNPAGQPTNYGQPPGGQYWNYGQTSSEQYPNQMPAPVHTSPQQTGYTYGNPYENKGATGGEPVAVGVPIAVVPGRPAVIVQLEPKPHNYMWLSCLVFWFCCWPLGLMGIYYSSSSTSAYVMGWQDLSINRAKMSLYMNIAGLVLGLILWVTIIVMFAIIQ